MAINDPEAIRFCNEVVRPLAERIRAFKADIDAARNAWDGGIGAKFPVDPEEIVEDGREGEGVSRLSGNDVAAFASLAFFSLKSELEEPGVPETVAKPCVRTLVTGG